MNFRSIKIQENEIENIFNQYNDSIIMVVSPSCNINMKAGSYHAALIYHKYRKIYCGQVNNVNSANKCAIYGLIEVAKHITSPKDIVIMTASSFGFKKAISFKGVNSEIWNSLFSILEEKGCENVTEVVVVGGGVQIASICRE